MTRILLFLLVMMAGLVRAETPVTALSQNTVAITANFNGSEIWIFGAVKRDNPVPEDAEPLHVVITVEGPRERVTVRRKERAFGIWINRDALEVDEAPSFYAIATTAPLIDILSATQRLQYRIGFDHAVRVVGAPAEIANPAAFTEAIIRIRKENGLYSQDEGIVDLEEETLFTTQIALPANLVEGNYTARMYLLRDLEVLSWSESSITVRKEGLERLIYATAHERPLLYGLVSIAVALLAGWLASEVFRLLRR